MYNLEKYLVQYATFNWQHSYIDLKLNRNAINILFILFVLIFLTKWICNSRKHKKLCSISTQTDDSGCEVTDDCNVGVTEPSTVLVESIFNQKPLRYHVFHRWMTNFNEFQFSKNISKRYRIMEFDENKCDRFAVSQMKTVDNRELISLTFQLQCGHLVMTIGAYQDDQLVRQVTLKMTDIELSALIMMRIGKDTIVMKCYPDCVSHLNGEIEGLAAGETEDNINLAEFKRDFKLVMLQTLELELTSAPVSSDHVPYDAVTNDGDQCPADKSGHISDLCDDKIEEVEPAKIIHLNESLPVSDSNNKIVDQDRRAKEMMSHTSLFTTDSYDYYDQGEESPFHDRVSSKLVGRTLVVGLVKIVEAQELRTPLKSGYCVLELDEPYQRHVSHLISLVDYPVWNQHFVFSLNSNSQRLSIELFHATKKCQNAVSLGVSVIPISLIIVDPSENYFPINNNQVGSRKSWRCDVLAGAIDSRIPAFLIEFQIMKNVHDMTKATTADPQSDLSSNNSGLSLPLESIVRFADAGDAEQDAGGQKMQTIPEAQSPDNTLTKHRSDTDSKGVAENGRSNSVMRKLRHRFSRISVPWMTEKSKSDDCLDQISDEPQAQMLAHGSEIPVQPPAELFLANSKRGFLSKIPEVDLRNSRSLSISLKKVFKMGKHDQYREKSIEQLFKQMDPKLFDTISNEGFNRIMNNK